MAIYFLENTDWTNDGILGRCFFQFPFAIFQPSTEKHVALIDDFKNCHFEDLGDNWLLSFSYMGYDFFIDSHSHSTTTSFIAVQPDCPDNVLLQIIGLFSDPMKISADYESSRPVLLACPDERFPGRYFGSRYFRTVMRVVAVAFVAFAFHSYFNGDYENCVVAVSGAMFVGAASCCSDFEPFDSR